MRGKIVKLLSGLNAFAVENIALVGTPDINYIEGWIECKWLREWPRRESSPVVLDHPLKLEQKLWIHKRKKKGGNCWVLLQCRRDWLLFDGAVARNILGEATKTELFEQATLFWTSGINKEELIKCLQKN